MKAVQQRGITSTLVGGINRVLGAELHGISCSITKVNITYRWWRSDKKAIKPAHVEALEETAMDRIVDQMREGSTSGELNDNIHMTARDPDDGIEYSGYWEFAKS